MKQPLKTLRKPVLVFVLIALYAAKNNKTVAFRPIGIFYGVTNRFDLTYRHVITLDYWNGDRFCIGNRYFGFGLNSEFTNKSNYSIGFRFYQSPRIHHRTIGRFPIFYWALAPSIYTMDKRQGINISPEIGAYWNIRITRKMGAGVHLYYGYDIPIVNRQDFSISRHHLTLKLGFTYNMMGIRSKLKKEKNL